MFDAATLNEEINAMFDHNGALKAGFKREYAIKCARWLREIERRERDDAPRSAVTGY